MEVASFYKFSMRCEKMNGSIVWDRTELAHFPRPVGTVMFLD